MFAATDVPLTGDDEHEALLNTLEASQRKIDLLAAQEDERREAIEAEITRVVISIHSLNTPDVARRCPKGRTAIFHAFICRTVRSVSA